jgi:uncharacterized membrane protein YqjE
MSATNDSEPQHEGLSHMITGLVKDVTGLMRKEIELAKTEVNEKASRAIQGGELVAIGAILAIGGLGVLLAAVVTGLSIWLTSLGLDALAAHSISALIVAVVVGGAGWMMISSGLKRIKHTNINLERTTSSIARDADLVKERLQ